MKWRRRTSAMVSFRRLERVLWFFLVWIGSTSLWMGISLQDPSDTRLVGSLSTGKGASTRASTINLNQTTAHQQGHALVGASELVLVPMPMPMPMPMPTNQHQSRTDSFLWTSNPVIPDWMKEYMDWHASVVATLSLDNWEHYNFLVLRCYRKDERCGGVSDRLKPVPLMVLAAQRSNRVLFIDWDRPCPLSEFLVPPPGGFQWAAPTFLLSIFQEHPSLVLTRAANLIERCQDSDAKLIQNHIHDTQGGMTQYDRELGTGSFQQIYHELFRIFFVPSPGVQRLIDLQLQLKVQTNDGSLSTKNHSLLLVEGEYSVAHYRAEYGREISRHPLLTEPAFLRKVAINAIRCASELQPQRVPIYFASDNALALETARELATTLHYPIITFDRSEKVPLKLDDYNKTTPVRPSDYYSTFVDLYVAGSGKCVTHGRGGFGRFASLLSFNASCSFKHVKQFFPVTCEGRSPFRGIASSYK